MMLVGTLSVATACDGTLPSVPHSDAVSTYVVLARDSIYPGDSLVSALVATTGSPSQAVYRRVEEFTMTRLRDGATFAWSIIDLAGRPIPTRTVDLATPIAGNVTLARTSVGLQLGRDALEDGERYAIHLVTEGVLVEGNVRIPARPSPVRLQRAGQEVVAWPRVPGGAGYVIQVETDRAPSIALSDTEYVVRRDRPVSELPPQPRVIVRALDSNLVRLLSDTSVRSAGPQGAYGVFGALSTGMLTLSPASP
jgi:hypothetical protein